MIDKTFPLLDEPVRKQARDQALYALNDSETPSRLAAYYNPRSNFAGATFAQLEPNPAYKITAADLLAVTTLSVSIPVHGIRRILEDDEFRGPINAALRNLPTRPLESTNDDDLEPMAQFYDRVKAQLSRVGVENGNPWVTASKVVARKRPDLFPVRDNVVCRFLGIDRLRDRAKDWSVFRFLMNDEEISLQLQKLPAQALQAARKAGTPIALDSEPLRLLDVALWSMGR